VVASDIPRRPARPPGNAGLPGPAQVAHRYLLNVIANGHLWSPGARRITKPQR
jgi:hypothetical protein